MAFSTQSHAVACNKGFPASASASCLHLPSGVQTVRLNLSGRDVMAEDEDVGAWRSVTHLEGAVLKTTQRNDGQKATLYETREIKPDADVRKASLHQAVHVHTCWAGIIPVFDSHCMTHVYVPRQMYIFLCIYCDCLLGLNCCRARMFCGIT